MPNFSLICLFNHYLTSLPSPGTLLQLFFLSAVHWFFLFCWTIPISVQTSSYNSIFEKNPSPDLSSNNHLNSLFSFTVKLLKIVDCIFYLHLVLFTFQPGFLLHYSAKLLLSKSRMNCIEISMWHVLSLLLYILDLGRSYFKALWIVISFAWTYFSHRYQYFSILFVIFLFKQFFHCSFLNYI